MNPSQRTILCIGLALFAITLLFIPITYTGGMSLVSMTRPVWGIKPYEVVDYGSLAMWWGALVVVTGGLMFAVKGR